MKVLKTLATALVAVAGLSYGSQSFAQQGSVYVVHGIPGGDLGLAADLPVDVSVNGACALTGFTFGEIVGPLGFDAGSYDIDIALANTDTPCANDPVLSAPGIQIEAGENYSIVAHLDEAVSRPVSSSTTSHRRSSARVSTSPIPLQHREWTLRSSATGSGGPAARRCGTSAMAKAPAPSSLRAILTLRSRRPAHATRYSVPSRSR